MSVIAGMVGPAMSLVGAGFMECDQQVEAVVMLTLSVGLCGFHFSGYFINHGDIAPQFAGTLFGLSNMMATVPGIFSPYVVSAMTKDVCTLVIKIIVIISTTICLSLSSLLFSTSKESLSSIVSLYSSSEYFIIVSVSDCCS